MRSQIVLTTLFITILLVTGCGGSGGTEMAALPTTTPVPTQPVIPATNTPLPEPTVTPFPTATPGGAELAQAEEVVAESAEAGQPADETTEQPAGAEQAEVQPTATKPPAATATSANDIPVLELGPVIYQADFSVGWPTIEEPTARMLIADGRYLMEIGPFDARHLSTTAFNQRNLFASIDANPAECPERGGYGLMFRYQDTGNYLLFTIFCDNTFTVVGRLSGSLGSLDIEKTAMPSGIDATTPEDHNLAVLTKGNEFTIYVDGEELISLTSGLFAEGDIAFYTSSQGVGRTRVSFDNLEVRELR